MRRKIVDFAVISLFLLLTLGLLNLQILHGRKLKELGNKNCIRLLPQEGMRGRILDRHGNVIVDNYLTYNLMILPQDNDSLDKTLTRVARILGTTPNDLKNTYKRNYIAPFMPVTIAENIEIKKAIAIEELKIDLTGIVIQPKPTRRYPYGRLASHIIGYLNEIDHWRLTKLADYGYKTKDTVGYTGVEERYDYYLRQEEGALSVEVDNQSRFVRVLGFKSPQNGKDIELTIDLKIQKIAEDKLAERKGSVIIMDPSNGEIIAMASFPNYNPAIFVKKSTLSIANLFKDPDSALINRAISGLYSPGSVFKLVVGAAGLETNKINPGTTFFCSGGMNIGKRKFNCWDTHHQQDLSDAIAHSCDVFFYRTGLLLGAQTIHNYALRFAFSKPTSIDLPYEAVGFVPNPRWKRIYRFQNWFDGDTANFAIGQGDLLVTPLQVVRMMAVFANQGFLVNPYIIKAVDGQDNSVYQKKISRINIKEKTLVYIREGARRAVSDARGTANVLSNLGISLAGKTGTVQVSRAQPHGWFIGFFPFKNPKFVICVFLEHGGSGYGACVLTKQIIETMIKEGLI